MEHTSLYRRYRPRRFSEIKGQDHVVAALQNAITQNRVFHTYLLSGPRGTGKTTAARVLSKALNCEKVENGEPCCECESCLNIDSGTSFDLHELDAASNNKVDDIRDLLAKVSLGTPGRTKVYLLDEVHMLTPGAENALLKTLEEPPNHVVFVLATTEPHKVVETIRSRAQHLELNLLTAAKLEELVEEISLDAGLGVDADGLAHAVKAARGSARDALSALDKVFAGGSTSDDLTVTDLLEAIANCDSSKALAAINSGIGKGREPRFIGESLLKVLRESFLLLMGVSLEEVSEQERKDLQGFIEQVSPAIVTNALELLGLALVEMRRSPDPRVDLEMALVRITTLESNASDPSNELSNIRIMKLEEQVSELVLSLKELKETLLDETKNNFIKEVTGKKDSETISIDNKVKALRTEGTDEKSDFQTQRKIDFQELSSIWSDELLPSLSKKARARFSAAKPSSIDEKSIRIALPNEPHLRRCAELLNEVKEFFKQKPDFPMEIELIVEEINKVVIAPSTLEESGGPENYSYDPEELIDADPNAGSAVEKLAEAFPGSELIESEGKQRP